eukprot:m.71657 g.71657  ORF g.71657 m.71657 type:complete len:420 (-) comp10076_c0_seq3:1667-2926(-)
MATSAFIPAREDVPTYMLPMLNDTDRNLAYESAIREKIKAFKLEHGRGPHVLDLGAGTGLLTLMAVKHGAARVTMLEANETVQSVSAEQIEVSLTAMGCDPTCCEQVCGLSVDLQKEGDGYDMVISELLGSMVNSESQYIYVWDLLMRGVVRNFGSHQAPKFYTIPESGSMTLRMCSAPCGTGLVTGIEYAPMNTLYDAVYDRSFLSEKVQWTQDEEMKLCLADCATPISDEVEVLHEQYDAVSGGVKHPRTVELVLNDPSRFEFEQAVLVLEWTVQLSSTVTLKHTLDHVAKLSPIVKAARTIQWGHLFAPLSSCTPTATSSGKYRFSVDYKPDGLDVTTVGAAATSAAAPAPKSSPPAASAAPAGERSEKRRRIAPTLVSATVPSASGGGDVLLAHVELAKFVMATKMLSSQGVTSV